MGNLVFQATLGGQVNLVGPNTASTFNINVPTVNGNMVTTGDTGTVTNTMLAGSIANAKLTNSSVTIGGTSIALGASSSAITNDITINGATVGRGAGAVSTNTAVGASALALNAGAGAITAVGANAAYNTTTGGGSGTAVGYQALYANTTGGNNTAIGREALYSNTTANNNTAVGYVAGQYTTTGHITAVGSYALQNNTTGSGNTAVGGNDGTIDGALYLNTTGSYNTAMGTGALKSNTTASYNTAVGYQAGYSGTTGYSNTLIGYTAGYLLTTGTNNTFIGQPTPTGASGYAMTTGSKNTIIGGFSGNQGGLDIRTSSNYIVLSDGDGNPRLVCDNNGNWGSGTVPSSSYGFYVKGASAGGFLHYQNAQFIWATIALGTPTSGFSTANACSWISKDSVTSRSTNAAGTVNTNGSDYAEYMVKAGDFTVAKGDVIGINAEGKLTNIFSDAVSFVVKSTDPSFVGGDNWFNEDPPTAEDGTVLIEGSEWDAYKAREEQARQLVDRIAFSGQVPVNVTGATAGQYIIPVNDNGAIKGQAVSNPTFEQYQQAVGKVIAIEQDGRARIIVKVA